MASPGWGHHQSAAVEIPEAVLQEYRASREQQNRESKINRRIAAAAALSAWIYAGVATFQWSAMQGQLTVMQETNRKTDEALEVARQAADAAAASVRAWISPVAWQILGEKDSRESFVVMFKNVGKTPALQVKTSWEYVFVPGPDLSQAPEFGGCPTGGEFGPGLIGIDAVMETDVPSDPLPEEKLKMLREKTAHLYIHGCVRYHDVLTPHERVTEVAMIFPGPTQNDLTAYDRYNRMK